MNLELYIASVTLVFAGLAASGLALAYRRGLLRRNLFAGLRSPKALACDEAWKRAHDATNRALHAGGALLAVGGFAALVLRPESESLATALLLVPTLAAAAVLVTAGVRGHRLAGKESS